MFEQVFENVMEELGLENWWELYDSENFDLVVERISERLGHNAWDDPEFIVWQDTMADDL